jgi:hypothetical protein
VIPVTAVIFTAEDAEYAEEGREKLKSWGNSDSSKDGKSLNAEGRSSSAIAGREALATAEGGSVVGRPYRREPQGK